MTPEIRISEQKDIERKSDKKDAIYYKYYARNSRPDFKSQRTQDKPQNNHSSRRNYHKSGRRNYKNERADYDVKIDKHDKHSRASSNESKKGSEISTGEKRIRLRSRSRSRSVSNPRNINN